MGPNLEDKRIEWEYQAALQNGEIACVPEWMC